MPTDQNERQIARTIVAHVSTEHRTALESWIEEMLSIRRSDLSPMSKAKAAMARTSDREVLVPVIKTIGAAMLPADLENMLDRLHAIRRGSGSVPGKSVEATKVVATSLKQFAWDDRGIKARLALAGAIAGAVLFGGQGAGIAALGTAIGVPLWVVFGAGAAFLGVLYEELTGKPPPKTTYRVIDAEPEDESAVTKLPRN